MKKSEKVIRKIATRGRRELRLRASFSTTASPSTTTNRASQLNDRFICM